MKNISKKNTRNFKAQRISKSLKYLNEKFIKKFGKLEYTIHSKWSEIVGSFFEKHSEPFKISSILNSKNIEDDKVNQKILHVNVTPSAAVEFQHFQDKIIEKINSYFGFRAISRIKIHQKMFKNKTLESENQLSKIKYEDNKGEIKNLAKKIEDKKLEDSIVNLGLSIKNNK